MIQLGVFNALDLLNPAKIIYEIHSKVNDLSNRLMLLT